MNKAILSGTVLTEIEASHEICGEKFYKTKISCMRKSQTSDFIPCIIPEVVMADMDIKKGDRIEISGEIRTRNILKEDGKRKLDIYLFANSISACERDYDYNRIEIGGCPCKNPIYRVTPKGREVTDLLLKVNRHTAKSDYIPCIAWGRNAYRLAEVEVETHLSLIGRLQSREYTKKFEDGTEEVRTAYEVSVSKFYFTEE